MKGRITSIDALKGCAIIAVLLLHSLDNSILSAIKATTHIGQAVPVFALVTFYLTFLSLENRGGQINGYYSIERVKRMGKRIVFPFVIVTFAQCLLLFYASHLQALRIIRGGGMARVPITFGYIFRFGL